MSSPSPGKRRMDTDVIKLYPCVPFVGIGNSGRCLVRKQNGARSMLSIFGISCVFLNFHLLIELRASTKSRF